MKCLPLFVACSVVALSSAVPASAQKRATPAGEAPGPWILGTIGVGRTEDPKAPKTTALKGIAIKVGENGEAAVAYDLDLCRMVGAWTGKFTTPMNLMSRGDYPTAMGEVVFTTDGVPGFLIKADAGKMDSWKDVRPEPFGPLPKDQIRFKGFALAESRTILKWEVGGREILEMPAHFRENKTDVFCRHLQVGPCARPSLVVVARVPAGQDISDIVTEDQAEWREGALPLRALWNAEQVCFWRLAAGHLCLEIPPLDQKTVISITVAPSPEENKELNHHTFYALNSKLGLKPVAALFAESVTARWPELVSTTGELSSKTDEPYVVDTIKLPDPNPWNAPIFVGGFDFFPDGRAALCTFHGDVFVVSGIDGKLEKVTWRRFATGLYHALGLKIVNGEIYVTCRDGLWRLKDLNGDGEADLYEFFNGDIKVTKSFHEFVFDLQTDPAGNFYFSKAGPVKNGGRGFDQIMAHHGSILRVSPDGAKLDVVATGFRAPNGIGCGPDGQLTSGDNEGTWTPVCKINWIKPGGFYGVVPLAHRDPPPTDYDRPLCWLPKRVDNSGGGQVWVTSDKWGPWKDQLLHLSYGTCSVFGVMNEPIRRDAPGRLPGSEVGHAGAPLSDALMQGGVVRFPVNFQSGIMRARFNPVDGQLYVAGLRGWQTSGVKNGCFQRVRYTGAQVRMPIGLHATKKGMRLDFTCALDPASAGDPQNWNVEVWNYLWSSAYGSPEFSTLEPVDKPGDVGKEGEPQFTKAQAAQKKHDTLAVKSATLSADGKSVFLEIQEIKPVMQMSIKFGLKSADGAEVRSEVVNTIHALLD